MAAALCHRDEMLEDERIAPGEGFLDLADGVIFVEIHIVHEQRADFVRTHGGGQIAVVEPLTFVILANRRPAHINAAAAPDVAIAAKRSSRLLQLFDVEDLAAMSAGAAAFSGNFQHVDGGTRSNEESPPVLKESLPLRNRAQLASPPKRRTRLNGGSPNVASCLSPG